LEFNHHLDPYGPKAGAITYKMHSGAAHTMSVHSLADLLVFGGYLMDCPYPTGVKDPDAKPDPDAVPSTPRKFEEMDDELVDAMNLFLANSTSPLPEWVLPPTC
jgi:hypothetical protein